MKLLLTGAYKFSAEQLDKIQSLRYEITTVQDERVPLHINVSEYEAVVCNGLFIYNDITKFNQLKYIQLTSVGLDRVPLDYIHQRGIQLANAGTIYSTPMAEWVILKILEIYKQSKQFYQSQSKHQWEKRRDLFELTGKTAAIIGFGSVGVGVAKRLKAFDVTVIAVTNKEVKAIETGFADETVPPSEINSVLMKSDIVILTVPLTQQTHHLINKNALDAMKKDSVLINVSRGGVLSEEALVDVLQDGKLLGVALDVFEQEPLKEDSALWDLERVIITPHNSFVSDQVHERLFNLILENLKHWMDD